MAVVDWVVHVGKLHQVKLLQITTAQDTPTLGYDRETSPVLIRSINDQQTRKASAARRAAGEYLAIPYQFDHPMQSHRSGSQQTAAALNVCVVLLIAHSAQ